MIVFLAIMVNIASADVHTFDLGDINHSDPDLNSADLKVIQQRANKDLPRVTTVYANDTTESEDTDVITEETSAHNDEPIATIKSPTGEILKVNAFEVISNPASRIPARAFAHFMPASELLLNEFSATVTGPDDDLGIVLDRVSMYDHLTPGLKMLNDEKKAALHGRGATVFAGSLPVRVHGPDTDNLLGFNEQTKMAEFSPEPVKFDSTVDREAPKGSCTLPDGTIVPHKASTCLDGKTCRCVKGRFKCKKKKCKTGRSLRITDTTEEDDEEDEDGEFISTTIPGTLEIEVVFLADSARADGDGEAGLAGDFSPQETGAPAGFRVLSARLTVAPSAPQKAAGVAARRVDFTKIAGRDTAVARTTYMDPEETEALLRLGDHHCDPLLVDAAGAPPTCTPAPENSPVGPRAAALRVFLFAKPEARGTAGMESIIVTNGKSTAELKVDPLSSGSEVSAVTAPEPGRWPRREAVMKSPEELATKIDTEAIGHLRESIRVITSIAWWRRFFTIRKTKWIKVCPVRVAQVRCTVSWLPYWMCPSWWRYTASRSGSGLAFGKPNADSIWNQAGVRFSWQGWRTVNDSTGKYASVTTGEMSSLLGKVNVGNCVEVFFVKQFSPSSTYGGGACWSGGTASAKIMSSDEQVSCGVDKTHLAHELGHAIGLGHPGSATTSSMVAGTPGTLMCGSGWQRDNPRRQSHENANNVQSPLFYSSWWSWGLHPNPACRDATDCGTCAAHIPSDSC